MHPRYLILLLVVISIFLSICAISIGVISIPWQAIYEMIYAKFTGSPVPSQWEIYVIPFFQLRLPRVVLNLIVGATLAICGTAFQAIFRNPICDPYILGISSGASLGAAIAIILGINTLSFGISGFALIGALLTLIFVLSISSMGNQKSMETILLAGIAVNFFICAIITLLIVLHQESLDEILFWTMGSIASATWKNVAQLGSILFISIIWLFFNSKKLNIIQLGQDTAQTVGVNYKQLTMRILIVVSLLIACTVANCGVIGFIGLVIPHISRILVGNNYRNVLIISCLLGGIFCLIADTIARTIAAPAELPVGSITAIVGAPYFIILLLSHKYSTK